MSNSTPSITFFIASIGHITLDNTLRSLYGQFDWGIDKIELFFDGKCEAGIDYFKTVFDLYNNHTPDTLRLHVLNENLGYWGHGIRNKYQSTFKTDYLHHMDDDDAYYENVIPQVKADLRESFGKLIIYKFMNINHSRVGWRRHEIEGGFVGTPAGLIPNRPEIFGTWGYEYGGDEQFYKQMESKIGRNNIVFKPTFIVCVRPHIYGMKL